MGKAKQNTKSVVKQFRQVLMGLYTGQYDIISFSVEPEFDERIMSPSVSADTGNRILTIKYNLFKRREVNK